MCLPRVYRVSKTVSSGPVLDIMPCGCGKIARTSSEQSEVNSNYVYEVNMGDCLQGLLSAAAPGVDPQALAKADISAIPKTLPVLSLAFVYHNIIPVIATDLEACSSFGKHLLLCSSRPAFKDKQVLLRLSILARSSCFAVSCSPDLLTGDTPEECELLFDTRRFLSNRLRCLKPLVSSCIPSAVWKLQAEIRSA